MLKSKPVLLVVLDGWGLRADRDSESGTVAGILTPTSLTSTEIHRTVSLVACAATSEG